MASRTAPELRERVRIDARPKAKRDAARRKELMEEAQMQQFARQAVSDTRRVEGETRLDAQGNTWRYNAATGKGENLGRLDPVTGQSVSPVTPTQIIQPPIAAPVGAAPVPTPGSVPQTQPGPVPPVSGAPVVAGAVPGPAPSRTVSVGGQYGTGSVTHGVPGVKSTIPIAPKPVIADQNGAVDLKASMKAGRTINAAPNAAPANIAGVSPEDNARLNANDALLRSAKAQAGRLTPAPVNTLPLPINSSSVTAITKPAAPAAPAAVAPLPPRATRPEAPKFQQTTAKDEAYTSL